MIGSETRVLFILQGSPGSPCRSRSPESWASWPPSVPHPVWPHVKGLITGAVLAPGPRTVTAVLPIMGLSAAADVHTSHRVLKRAVWSPLQASRLRLRRVVAVCIPWGVVLFGLDDSLARRRGAQLNATGLDRDPVRSSPAYGVNVRGRRWVACRVRPPLAWATRVWARRCLTVLGPAARVDEPRGRHHPTVTARAGPMIRLVGRWLPGRESAVVTDSRVAALERLDQVKAWPWARVSTRRRLDAALSDPPPPRPPESHGRPRLNRPASAAAGGRVGGGQDPMDHVARGAGAGAGPREVAVTPDTAGWDHAGTPPVVIRWGLMREPPPDVDPRRGGRRLAISPPRRGCPGGSVAGPGRAGCGRPSTSREGTTAPVACSCHGPHDTGPVRL